MVQRCKIGRARPSGRLARLSAAALFGWMATGIAAENPSLDEIISGVVRVRAAIHPEGRTVPNLGRERLGSAIVIDHSGLALTIGYLIVEAQSAKLTTNDGRTVPAEVVGYDYDTGFGLLRALAPLNVRPLEFGKSAELKEGDPVLVASFGGRAMVAPVRVAAKREFAGNWEYLLDEAIFTAPPHPVWSGAALLNRAGKLVGVGSLIVGDSTGKGDGVAGNMFVPIDRLAPILADLIAAGRAARPARPWLGLNLAEIDGRLFVTRVTPDSPAAKAGLKRGDIILGVAGAPPKGLADFYRKLWALGEAGAVVPLEVMHGNDKRAVDARSINRARSPQAKINILAQIPRGRNDARKALCDLAPTLI